MLLQRIRVFMKNLAKKLKKGVDTKEGAWYYIQVAEIRRQTNLEN